MDSLEPIKQKIYEIRGQRVMLDFDLAAMYGVETKRLNEQVKRNIERFPEDFMFQLTKGEFEILKSQISNDLKSHFATSNHSDSQEIAILKSQNATSSWGVADRYQSLDSLLNYQKYLLFIYCIISILISVLNFLT